jgi:hypothetical protein
VAAARAEADDADLAVGLRPRPQPGRSTLGVADHLVVGDTAGCAHAGADVVGAARPFAEIEVRGDGGEAVMGKLAHHLDDPLIPAGHVVDEDDARELSRRARTRIVSFAIVAVVAAKRHGLRNQPRVRHASLMFVRLGGEL